MDLDLLDFDQTPETATFALDDAPAPTASYETRAAWSERYVLWFISQTDEQASWASDIDATHRFEIEFNSCVLDPQTYERQTREELTPERLH